MKRILKICSPQLGMDPNSDLGGEVHDHFIIQGIADQGHKIFVYLPKERHFQKNPNIFVSRAPFKHILAILFNLIIIPYIFRIYKKEKFDILRIHNPYFIGLGAMIFKLINPKVPIVATHHLISDNFLFNFINAITAKKYDAIIAVSKNVKDRLIRKYEISANKIHVIYNGVSKDYKFSKKDPKLLEKYNLEEKIVILFMGLLIKRKNPMFLLEIFKKIKSKNRQSALIFCGRGPLEKEMKNFVKNNKIHDVIFVGRLYGKNKINHINLCDIYVHPAIDEGLPLSAIEAMACAKPIIVGSAYSAKEIVQNGQNGYICKINNKKEWSEKINKLIGNNVLRKKMSETSENMSSNRFQWEFSIRNHIKVFESLIRN